MIYTGRIIDVTKEYAIVLTNHLEYYKINLKDGLYPGAQIIFLEEDIYMGKYKKLLTYSKYVALLIIILISTMMLTQIDNINNIKNTVSTPAALISLDINPSVEFEIDKDNKLINIIPKNEEGKLIVSNDMLGEEIQEVLYLAINNAKSLNYIKDKEQMVLIGIGIIDENFIISSNDLLDKVENRVRNNDDISEIKIVLVEGNMEDIEASKSNNMTIGKYRYQKNAPIKNEESNLNDVNSNKMNESEEELPNRNTNRYKKGIQNEINIPGPNNLEVEPKDNVNRSQYKNQNSIDDNVETIVPEYDESIPVDPPDEVQNRKNNDDEHKGKGKSKQKGK